MHCSLSSFWKVGSEGRGNCKAHSYLSGIKHGLTNGADINNKNNTINCCIVVLGVPFSCIELGGKLMCLLMWSRWLLLKSSNKEGFLVNCSIVLNRQFFDTALYLVCWHYVQGVKYNLPCLVLAA